MTENKDKWGPGPWQDEPDYMEWIDQDTGYPCKVRRNHDGAWCGYVGVLGINERGFNSDEIDVHGGVTFGDFDDSNLYWLGFDCSHAWDQSPGLDYVIGQIGVGRHTRIEIYRTMDFAINECMKRAKQLKQLEKRNERCTSNNPSSTYSDLES